MGNLVEREGRFLGWEYTETMSAGTNSDPIPIPPLGRIGTLTAALVITSGEGKVQVSTSPDAAVVADTANWQDWEAGSVTSTTADSLMSQVSAVRFVRTSGTVTLELVI